MDTQAGGAKSVPAALGLLCLVMLQFKSPLTQQGINSLAGSQGANPARSQSRGLAVSMYPWLVPQPQAASSFTTPPHKPLLPQSPPSLEGSVG